MNRRQLLAMLSACLCGAGGMPAMASPSVGGKEGLRRLMDGNKRFVAGSIDFAHRSREYRDTLTKAQHPFATILGCSDSRVPVEMVFDAGFGDLFVVRVAGNVVAPDVRGSIAYAFEHLRTPLFMVLGHEGCGAVTAALEERLHNTHDVASIDELLRLIDPALQDLPKSEKFDRLVNLAVEANVRWSIRQLTGTPTARKAIDEGDALVVGAVYELAQGRVRLLD